MKKTIYLFAIILTLASCNSYQKALNSDDVELKFTEATKQFDAKKYTKSLRLLEQIAPAYKGKPQAEKMFHMLSESYYITKQYYLAAYQYESFASSYPKSEKREEALFLSAKCFSKLSPDSALDQTDTNKALDKLQNFIDLYPDSKFLPEANQIVFDLKYKLEKKAYEIALLYNSISDYKAAINAFDNFIEDFPGTKFKEDALYYRLDSAYNLAINSIPQKMQERLIIAQEAYNKLVKFKTDTKHKEKADSMLEKIQKDLQQFSK